MVISEDDQEVTLKADAVIWCTGWQPGNDYFEPEEAKQLGLPTPIPSISPTQADKDYDNLLRDSETKVQTLLPELRASARPGPPPAYTPYRFYRLVLSPERIARNDRSIAFVGFVANAQTALTSELLALWAVAYLEDLLGASALPSEVDMVADVALSTAWMKRRYGYRGVQEPHIAFEVQSFLDLLCRDLGVQAERKKRSGGWTKGLREWVGPYTPKDFEGVIGEFLEAREKALKG